ncbi:Thioredoxin/Thioredoxin-like domain/Thioredoxin-like [Novymonas esmeraldas]|uniref:Thioredoxin/Thioredoxin-like domain/Thioredoxin-like n=1 Tax=Novymonas esmeraldas TaxID=1808958 RepID=A0AAW0F349_9TRYP
MRLQPPTVPAQLLGALLVLACLVPTVSAFPYGKSSPVTELTAASLNSFVNTHKPVVILFYAPWCGHCKQFHPEFERFAESVKGTIRVGAIDADKNSNIGQQFGVRGFPTIKYWKSGGKSVATPLDYQGQRTAAALQSLMVGDISSSKVVTVTSTEQLRQAARQAPKSMVGVLFSAKERVPPMVSVMALSPKLAELPLAFAGGCSPQKGVAAAFGVAKLPALGVVRYTPAAGDSQERYEFVAYAKAAIAYEPVARFFLDCAEKGCGDGGDGAVPVQSANLDEEEAPSPTAAAAAAAPRQFSMALPVEPVPYTSKVISNFCAPQTRKIRGQSPLCVFSVSEDVRLESVQKYFQNDPILFFDATHHRDALQQQFQSDFGVQLLPDGEDTAGTSSGFIVVLRHSKPTVVRYALLEHINSDDDLQAILQRLLNGEVSLQTTHIGAA